MAVREDRPQAGRRSRSGYAEGGFGAGTQKLSKRSRLIRVKENEAWKFHANKGGTARRRPLHRGVQRASFIL